MLPIIIKFTIKKKSVKKNILKNKNIENQTILNNLVQCIVLLFFNFIKFKDIFMFL